MSKINIEFWADDPSFDNIMNCSVSEDINFGNNFTRAEVFKISDGVRKLIEMLFGILIMMLMMLALHVEALILQVKYRISAKTVSRTLGLLALACLLPFVSFILTLAFGYKIMCKVLIKRNDEYFVKYLDSFDVFWCLENDVSKSIINVLGVIESDSSRNLVKKIREKLNDLPYNYTTEKMFYTRCEKYGFYYWRRHNFSTINLNEYVDVVELSSKTELKYNDLEDLMSEISAKEMPSNNKGLFQILVTKYRVKHHNDGRGDYGIIFRVHHSVGDGLALIEFLCKTLADKYKKNTLIFPASQTENNDRRNTFANVIKMMTTLLEMPVCLIDGILRKPDENSLHGPKLLGTNIFKWTQSNENLLVKIKEIKSRVTTLNFLDILSAALSKGLQNYFTKTMNVIPAEVAVVLPVPFPNNLMRLENNFSVTIMDLPIRKGTNMEDFKKCYQNVRDSADPLGVSSALPSHILKPLLNSSQATLVLSNMPGPERMTICGGDDLKSLVFFVPNKGTTGLGVTALCYGNVLRFAAMADTAVVSSPEELAVILNEMEAEVERLHRLYVQ